VRRHRGPTPLTVLTPVCPGEEQRLADHLAGMPTGEDSPFHRLAGTHFARWVFVGHGGRRRGLVPVDLPVSLYLLFTATFDGPVDGFIEELRVRIGGVADAVWGHCVGYPGHLERDRFRRYLNHNTLPIHRDFVAYDVTVAEVRRALRLREQHIGFATRSDAGALARPLARPLAQRTLQQAFLEHFRD
jgi:hypothetical protein